MGAREFIDRAKALMSQGPMLLRLVAINVAVFVALRLAAIGGMFATTDVAQMLLGWLELPSSPAVFLTRPWTILTYMFTQYDVMHILFNMLWLYWFGTLFCMAATPRQLAALYLLGGLGGGVLFMCAYGLLPGFGHRAGMLLGSSASVMAIVTATAMLMPDFRMNLLFIGAVKLKWIAVATIGLVLLGFTGTNAGGDVAHLGGIGVGALWAMQMRRGRDLTAPLCRLLDRLSPKPSAPRSQSRVYGGASGRRSSASDETDRATLDLLLEKVRKSGYASLSPEERRLLFEISRNIK